MIFVFVLTFMLAYFYEMFQHLRGEKAKNDAATLRIILYHCYPALPELETNIERD